MSIFDQREQTVTYQYNNAYGAPPEGIADRETLRDEIERLVKELAKAHMADAVPDEQASETKALLRQASGEAQAEKPDKAKLTSTMTKAAGALKGVASVAGLYEAIVKLAEHIPAIHL